MTVVAEDLSKDCGLAVYADNIWIGGRTMGLGMVFKGDSMGGNVRTPEDDEKLKRLEERLVDLKFVTTPKLEILCSRSFLPHLEEPIEMVFRTPHLFDYEEERIMEIKRYWRPGGEHDLQRQKEQKIQREKDATEMR